MLFGRDCICMCVEVVLFVLPVPKQGIVILPYFYSEKIQLFQQSNLFVEADPPHLWKLEDLKIFKKKNQYKFKAS